MANYLDTISSFVAELAATHGAGIPTGAREAGRWILLDTLGGMLAGSTLPESQGFARLAQESSPADAATLVGFERGASARYAAMVNATTACSFETDEGNRFGGGHPAIHVVPPALALAEEHASSGSDLLNALIVSYEVMSRISAGSPSRWPVHSHGTHGSPGSATAALMYLQPDAVHVCRALNLAACMTPATTWQACFDGGTVRNIYPAMSCFLGMLAVELEAVGYLGSNDGPKDVFGDILGHGGFRPEQVLDGLGEHWRVTQNYFKFHFSCAYTHPPLDAIFAILQRRPFSAGEVERITVTGAPVIEYLAGFEPINMLAMKFSIPHALAAAVVYRRTGLESFLDAARTDPALQSLAARVLVVGEQTRAPKPFHEASGTLVTVKLASGETLSEEVTIARGDAVNPVDTGEIVQKFRNLAGMRLAPDAVQRIVDLVMNVDSLGSVRELSAALRPVAQPATAGA